MALTTQTWKSTAIALQEEMCFNFSDVDWDAYEEGETNVLKNKIRMLLFGLSSDENEEVECHVDKMCEVIIKESVCKFEDTSKAVYMVFVFVVGTKDGENIETWPIFRVPKDDTGVNAAFIDISCRVYGNWQDFLESNKLPVHEYCYPKDGKYRFNSYGNAAIEFAQASESKTSKKIQKALDVFSTGVGFGASVLTIASLALPVAAPLVAASAWAAGGISVYTTFRSSRALYDRKKHKQDIGLGDKEARSCYISIAGSALGLGATAATSATVRMAQSGRVLGNTATSAVTALNGGALVLNGVGIANGLHHLIEKHKEGQLSPLDVAQFSASLLLFCHATANFKTARSIIEKSQDNVIQNYGNSLGSKWKRIMFRTAVKCTTKLRGPVGGKALIIRNIKHINTADEYFASLLPEDEAIFSQNPAVLISNSNINQMHGFEHLESLLNEYDKFTLRRLLIRFTEPIRKVILKLCDSFFQTMGRTHGFDLMHIANFVSEFVRLLTNFIYKGEKLFVLSLLHYTIHTVSFDGMSCYQYCLALFEELLLRPESVIRIYNLIKEFIAVSSDRTQMSQELQNVDFIKLVSACSVLLITDKPYWEIIIDFAKNIFLALNLKKPSSFVSILKELLLHIQTEIFAVQRRHEMNRYESSTLEEVSHTYDSQIRSDSASVLESLYDDEFHTTFTNNLQGMNIDNVPQEEIPARSMVSAYTMDNPLVFQKRFWDREQLELLSETEILETCKETLRVDDLTQNFSVIYDGLESFVTIGNTLVVIRCDLHNETVVSYAVLPATTSAQNDAP